MTLNCNKPTVILKKGAMAIASGLPGSSTKAHQLPETAQPAPLLALPEEDEDPHAHILKLVHNIPSQEDQDSRTLALNFLDNFRNTQTHEAVD